jgi:hypothetical protein
MAGLRLHRRAATPSRPDRERPDHIGTGTRGGIDSRASPSRMLCPRCAAGCTTTAHVRGERERPGVIASGRSPYPGWTRADGDGERLGRRGRTAGHQRGRAWTLRSVRRALGYRSRMLRTRNGHGRRAAAGQRDTLHGQRVRTAGTVGSASLALRPPRSSEGDQPPIGRERLCLRALRRCRHALHHRLITKRHGAHLPPSPTRTRVHRSAPGRCELTGTTRLGQPTMGLGVPQSPSPAVGRIDRFGTQSDRRCRPKWQRYFGSHDQLI